MIGWNASSLARGHLHAASATMVTNAARIQGVRSSGKVNRAPDVGACLSMKNNLGDLGGAAQRVGTMITEQVHLIVEDAERQADELRNEASSSADRTRRDATDSARLVLERIQALERPLAELVRSLNLEIEKVAGQIRMAEGLYPAPVQTVGELKGRGSPNAPAAGRIGKRTAPEHALAEAGFSRSESAPEAEARVAEAVETDSVSVANPVAGDDSGQQSSGGDETESPKKHEHADDPVIAAREAPATTDEAASTQETAASGSPIEEKPSSDDPSADNESEPAADVEADRDGPVAAGEATVAKDSTVEEAPATSQSEPSPTDQVEGDEESDPAANGTEGTVESSDSGEAGGAKGGRRGRFLGRLRRGGGPFITEEGQCAVCQRSFKAGSAEELEQSGWSVNGDVGLCPDCAAKGWQLPEGSLRPFRRGGGN